MTKIRFTRKEYGFSTDIYWHIEVYTLFLSYINCPLASVSFSKVTIFKKNLHDLFLLSLQFLQFNAKESFANIYQIY